MSWICDTCGEEIKNPEDGCVEWIVLSHEEECRGRDLRLVHAHGASSRTGRYRCRHNEDMEFDKDGGTIADLPLTQFVGLNGLMHLLVFISESQLPTDEVLQMIKRIHIPGYEQAWRHFDEAISEGVFEPNMPKNFYLQSNINATIQFLKRRKH